MPIYEYQCDACEGTFEAIQKFSDEPLEECRLCGNRGVRKLVSAPAFRLKGSGWYETDFKKNGQKNVVKSDSDGGGSSASSSTDSGSSAEKSGGSSDSAKASASKSSGKSSDAA